MHMLESMRSKGFVKWVIKCYRSVHILYVLMRRDYIPAQQNGNRRRPPLHNYGLHFSVGLVRFAMTQSPGSAHFAVTLSAESAHFT